MKTHPLEIRTAIHSVAQQPQCSGQTKVAGAEFTFNYRL